MGGMRAGGDAVDTGIGDNAERVVVGKNNTQSNDRHDVTVNVERLSQDDLALRVSWLSADVEDMRVDMSALNEKYVYLVRDNLKLSIALGITIIILMFTLYWFGSVLVSVHDDVIRLSAQVQRSQMIAPSSQEAVRR
jgi:hypothetical protein